MKFKIKRLSMWTCPDCKGRFFHKDPPHDCNKVKHNRIKKKTFAQGFGVGMVICFFLFFGYIIASQRAIIDLQATTIEFMKYKMEQSDNIDKALIDAWYQVSGKHRSWK